MQSPLRPRLATDAAPARPDLTTRLLIPYPWLQSLLVSSHDAASGEVTTLLRVGQCRLSDGSVEWLVREILPDRAALANPPAWHRFVAFSFSDGSRLAPWVESHLPLLPPQIIGEVFLGRSAFEGLAWGFARHEETGGAIVPMMEMVVPGRWMHRIPLQPVPAGRTPAVRGTGWSRTAGALGAGDEGEACLQRLRARPVAVFGGSRNGLFLGEWAVRMGIPLILVDDKSVQASHLGEISLLLGHEDIGRPKVKAFARRLEEWSASTVPVEAVVARAGLPDGARAARRAALLVDAVDNDAGRLAVALLATIFHRPQLSVASGVYFDGQGRRVLGADIRLLLPGDRCLFCLGGLTDYPRALRELAHPRTDAANPEAFRAERAGSLRSLNQAATAVGERLVEDLFAGRVHRSRWIRIEWSDDGVMTTREPGHDPRSHCLLCAKAGEGDAALGKPE